jgi:hypothetical protein
MGISELFIFLTALTVLTLYLRKAAKKKHK